MEFNLVQWLFSEYLPRQALPLLKYSSQEPPVFTSSLDSSRCYYLCLDIPCPQTDQHFKLFLAEHSCLLGNLVHFKVPICTWVTPKTA